ncbi:MAG: hypothetical protein GXY44_09115 [Phycisphaerales bacterium]|nr:hypothetical protein [Phycisphaerales bacterium]
MTRRALLASIPSIFTLLIVFVAGCVPTDPPGPDYPDDLLDLSEANSLTLQKIANRFLSLVGDGSDAAATSALMAELQRGFAGISSATLGADGCTISLQMSDESVALLNTNRSVFGSEDSSPAGTNRVLTRVPLPTAHKTIHDKAARTLPGSYDCPGKDTPPKRNVLIINTAAVSNPSTNDYVQQLQDALIAQGWPASDIELRSRAGTDNRTFTPLSLTQVEGYGMVFVIGQGCVADVSGVQHGYIQCCRTGSFTEILTPEELSDVLDERDAGRMIRCETPTESGGFVSDIYVRDDCLVEAMRMTPGAMVYFIAPHSWTVASGLAEQDASATLGWDGAFQGTDGQRAVLGMLARMTAANTWTTDSQAYANLMLSGLGLSEDPAGHATQARIAGTDGDFYLPAWGVFTVDTTNVPDDTTDVEVDVTYAACPDFSLNFTMAVTDTVDTLRLPAGEATIAVKALDITGEVLGSGLQNVPINGGLNDIRLITCKATVKLYLDEYPASGVNALARIRVEFIYPYALPDAPLPAELNLAHVAGWSAEIWAGRITIQSTALNAAGQVVGEQVQEVDIACGHETIDICFGWVRLEATRYPPNTKSVRVVSDDENAPGPFTLTPGGSTEVYGFRVDDLVNFTAEALDASGNVIASRSETVAITCGENDVPLDLMNYGIDVSADPAVIAADGRERSSITATLRYWQAGDTTTPTGRPVAGKRVEFGTTWGSLIGTNPATSNANGQVAIQLSGTANGLATVVASVAEDMKEGKCVVQIGNENFAYSLSVLYRGQGQQIPGARGEVGAIVKDAKGYGAADVPVHFRLIGGSIKLVEPLATFTDKDGHANVEVRSTGPAIGLVEVSVPDTLLIKHCVAYLQFTCSLSRTTASIEIDHGELYLEANPTVSLGSLGVPYQWYWHQYPRQGRLIHGGTAGVDAAAQLEAIPDTNRAKVSGGSEPDTSMAITAEPACEVDGEWTTLGWVPPPPECLVEFYQNVVATLDVVFESRSQLIDNVTPAYYEAKVVARFTGAGPASNIRYIVSNPLDYGQVSDNWWDGNNRTASNSSSPISIVINQASYHETQPPDSWIAQKLQSYQDQYDGMSISVSSYPYPSYGVSGDISATSFDPWRGW